MSKDRLNLSGATALIAESDPYVLILITRILRGFGLMNQKTAPSVEIAKKILAGGGIDICLFGDKLTDSSGLELVKFVRRMPEEPLRFVPIIILSGYTSANTVADSRDSGATFVLKKPISPQVVYDRLIWTSRVNRSFVEAGEYVGPDRRFKFAGPPDGKERRSTDLSAELGDAKEPNMSRVEIDALIKPMKVNIS